MMIFNSIEMRADEKNSKQHQVIAPWRITLKSLQSKLHKRVHLFELEEHWIENMENDEKATIEKWFHDY